MKKLFTSLLLISSLSLFASGSRTALNEKDKASVIEVLKLNEDLHAAFFDYKANEVEANSKLVAKSIDKITNADIKKYLKKSKEQLLKIKGSVDRKKNNELYNEASLGLIYVINKYDLGRTYNSYSCPMVKKKWVQNSKKKAKVHNPYAPEMPHCGRQDSRH
ncbi:MAG: hypothetical protein GY909_08780 [Oligoflexia bacterium]|nr:hypothetical protein [Oligoflexia bacterium]